MEAFFWSLVALIVFTYLGYPVSLMLLLKLRPRKQTERIVERGMPSMTFVIAAYNEENYIRQKIENTKQLSYETDRLQIVIVTDGSTDLTASIVKTYDNVTLFHQPERRGKVAAINRIMPYLSSEVVVLSDANTTLNADALEWIGKAYLDQNVGAVSGEKVVLNEECDDATAGEGMYWKYESAIKHWDSQVNSMVGCAGELMSFRRSLYRQVEEDTYIEDFVLSMRIAALGNRVVYCPQARASELPSASIGDEMKRKVRIAAGGLQAIWRLRALFNFFRYGILTYQYVGHRVLRWTLAPLSLPLLLIANLSLFEISWIYQLLLYAQLAFYSVALLGGILKHKKLNVKGLFVPYYFTMMNIAVFMGLARLIKRQQKVTWEKAERRLAMSN